MSEVFPGPGPAQHVPQPGQYGLQVGEGPATNETGFINVAGRLFAPLQGLDAANPRMGGYGWLSPTDYAANGVPQTLHPGVDLNSGSGDCNSDEGALCVMPLAGVVRAVLYAPSGEGNTVWFELDDWALPGPTWMHVDHLLSVECYEGQRLSPGETFGRCGRTGGWSCAHLHLELLKGPPQDGYWQWPYQWTKAQVEAAYYAPRDWWDAASAKVQGAPEEAVTMILSGAQSAVVQAAVWGDYWRPEADTFAIETSWREEWRRGVWRGRPLSDEQLLPEDTAEGKPGGAFRLFEGGAACWLPGQDVSWTG